MISRVFFLCCLAWLSMPWRAMADAPAPGTQDTAFISSLLGTTVYTLQPETVSGVQRIIAGGDLDGFDLLFSDGSNDTNLAIGIFGNAGRITYTAVPQVLEDGSTRILVGGLFGRTLQQVIKKLPGQNIVGLTPSLALDGSFDPGTGANGYVTSILPVSRITDVTGNTLVTPGAVVGGQFTQFNKIVHAHIVKLTEGGAIDPTFKPTLNINDVVLSLAAQPNPNAAGPQGQIVVAGTFSEVDGAAHNKLARLNADGTVDGTFNPSFDNRVVFVTTQPDGKILVGGDFENVNGRPANHIARLNYDGSLDTSFAVSVTVEPSGLTAPVSVYVIKLLGDGSGRMYLGGNFASINGVTRNFLGRINADGSLDTSFDPGKVIINSVQAIAEQPQDNKVLVGETRSHTGDTGRRPASLIRLHGDPVAPAVVTVTATDTVARVKNPGTFTFTRTGQDLTSALTVYVTRTGTAVNIKGDGNHDFTLTPSLTHADRINGVRALKVNFPANIAQVVVSAAPSTTLHGTRTVIFTVQSDQSGGTNYTLGSSVSGTVTIRHK